MFRRDNDALEINPPRAVNNITTHGSDVDWAICALHMLLFLGMLVWTYMANPRRRVFHYIASAILFITGIYYFVMASNLGSHAVPVEFRENGILGRTRQIFYARWIGYFLNFTLAWFALTLLSGVGWASILFTMGLSMLWSLLFLLGALVRTSYKWGFFFLALVTYFLLAWQTMGVARKFSSRWSADAAKIFTMLAAYELFMMLLYPIAWGVSEGGNKITNDGEQAFYAVLDTLSQGVFAYGLVWLTRALDFDHHGLGFSEYGRVRSPADMTHEKHAAGVNGVNGVNGTNGYTNGTNGVVNGQGNGVNGQTSAV